MHNLLNYLLVGFCIVACNSYGIKINFEQQYNAEIEAYSSGRISEKNEQFIQELADKVDECKFIQVRQPSPKLMELRPESQFNCFLSNTGYLFINDSYFNSLSEQEKRFLISCYLVTPPMQAARKEIDDMNKKKKLFFYVAGAIEVMTSAYIAYRYIPTDWLYFNMLKNYRPVAFLSKYALSSLLVEPIADFSIVKPYMRSIDKRIKDIESTLKKIHVIQFDCLEGAIGYSERMLTLIAPLLEEEPEYWKPLNSVLQLELQFYKAYKASLDQLKV